VNPALNEGLPPFLAAQPGLESGFMMVQVTAAALVAECRVLATPASPGSITTSGNKEDFVSMGMTSALKLRHLVELVRMVLAIELMTAVQGLETLRPLKSSAPLETVRAEVLRVSPARHDDQPFSDSIMAVAEWLKEWRTRRSAWSV